MLKQWEKTEHPSDAKLEERLQEARMKLQEQQLKVKEHGLPVLVLVEGWGTAGKGSLIGQIIKNIDPRFFKVPNISVNCRRINSTSSSSTILKISCFVYLLI